MMAEKAGRVVAEKIEDMLWNGYTGLGSNNTIYGYRTTPNRNTGSVTATWVTATGAQILADVLAMIQKAQDDHMYGPYVLYVPIAAMTNMGNDFKTEAPMALAALPRGPRVTYGVGISSNITRASLRGIFSAVNRLYGDN